MTAMTTKKLKLKSKINNLVAKHAHIHKHVKHKDKKNDYQRKEKFYKGRSAALNDFPLTAFP